MDQENGDPPVFPPEDGAGDPNEDVLIDHAHEAESLLADLPPDYEPPEAAAPNPLVYRGSLVALILVSFVALFLVINPPEDESSDETPREIATPTPAIIQTATPTPEGAGPTPVPTEATGGEITGTPETPVDPTETAATPTPEPGAPIEYEIQPGDSLGAIASSFGVTTDEILAINGDLADPNDIAIGQVILVPQP